MNLMRQIDNEVKPQWERIKQGGKLEGFSEDCPPSLLKGWTDDNLSLWEVGNPQKPELEKILFALCRQKRSEWDKITYLIFDMSAILDSSLIITQTNGKTSDSQIDNSKSHYEIKDLHGKNLCTLIYHITLTSFEIGNYKRSEFNRILYDSYDNLQVKAQHKTDAMSIQPSSIEATADTINNDILEKERNPVQDKESIISGSIDSSTGNSVSTST